VEIMATFTTNWYLYKTYTHQISNESQTRNPRPATHVYESEKGTEFTSKDQEAENKNFDEILLEAIDEGFSLLGDSSKHAVYFHLEKSFNMHRLDIPSRIEEFVDAIEKLFGAGAKILEIHIMKCLFKKVNYNFKHYPKQKNLTFTEYVAALKLEKDGNNIKEQYLNRKQRGKKGNIYTNNLRKSVKSSKWISRTSEFTLM
jgi:hypothetical protein